MTPMVAYLGPGGVLTFLGSAIALLAVLVVTFFGMVWYPIRKLVRRMKERKAAPVPVEDPRP